MNILINHCWCSDSIWGGMYDCDVIVDISRVPDGKSYYDPPDPDWALVETHPFTPTVRGRMPETLRLRPDVLDWLRTNVKDGRGRKGEAHAWAVGSDEYNAANTLGLSIFFQMQSDGMAFIKRWSHHHNPVSYLQYFKDIRKELDPTTGRLKRVPR